MVSCASDHITSELNKGQTEFDLKFEHDRVNCRIPLDANLGCSGGCMP